MCGIAGILAIQGRPPAAAELQAMNHSLAHRGPDDEGIYIDEPVGLAHRRLSIFDLSAAGHQPMTSSNGRYIITYNGEIYNWPEIRAQLQYKDWRSSTDTETLLQAFIEWGPDCLRQFNGMFALAIWDRQEKCLFLARDRVGIKPLYFATNDGRFLFGSEIKALIVAGLPLAAREETVYDFLRWGLIDHSEATFYDGVRQLKPGHWMIVEHDGSQKEQRYWDLIDIVRSRPTISADDAADEYGARLRETIKLYTRSDVPVGAFLSSGLDSSILISFMADVGLRNICTFTYDFDTSGRIGERLEARALADAMGVEHDHAVLSCKEVPAVFDRVLYHQEAPFTSMRVLAQHKLYQRARERGYIVILDGNGGDQVGGGFEYYWLSAVMDTFIDEGFEAGIAQFRSFMDKYGIAADRCLDRVLGTLAATLTPGVCTQDGVPFVQPELFSAGLRARNKSRRPNYPRPFQENLLNAQFIDLTYHNQPRVLRYADRCSMATGREQRVPVLDHYLIELGFCSAPDARIRGSEQRRYMREAARKHLPPSVVNRPKQSIVDPQRQWLKEELREWVGDLIHSADFAAADIFDTKAVQNEYQRYCSIDGVPNTGFHIFQIVTVGQWYRRIVHGDMLRSPVNTPEIPVSAG